MTDYELSRIRTSWEGTMRCHRQGYDWAHCIDTSILIERDVPDLLAEVERLRETNATLRQFLHTIREALELIAAEASQPSGTLVDYLTLMKDFDA